MCCLRYEQDAYEDLVKKMPKLGAFVQTPAGFGTVAQVNLLSEQRKGQAGRTRGRCVPKLWGGGDSGGARRQTGGRFRTEINIKGQTRTGEETR
jgi:hypothetical protein